MQTSGSRKYYKERCSKLAIPMNARARPKGTVNPVSRQGTLDGNVAVLPRVPPLPSAGLLDILLSGGLQRTRYVHLTGNACIIMVYNFWHRHVSWWTEGLPSPQSILPALVVLN